MYFCVRSIDVTSFYDILSEGENGLTRWYILFSFYCNECDDRFGTTLCDKRDDFNFPVVNFPFISSNILATLAFGVHIS